MGPSLPIILITAFVVADIYYDRHYTTIITSYAKYYKMAAVLLTGLGAVVCARKTPRMGQELAVQGIQALGCKLVPGVVGAFSKTKDDRYESRIANSGKRSTKRSVSETKKKYVAASQDWKCKKCGVKLPAWFEVDHRQRLEDGGSNHVSNLEALCRECHGEKTALENL